uniref:WW domain-containing protein n=1 Tax=Alexandrium andersonii TaxID=327968 RepID=A0A7S2AHG8_9DINO|mmetsp:Transcript_12041/g.27332  ORF Transcript_12041/g.27332 Transcript_12041/m.27332 type:complete len:276 (+) Transcript_12041:80-907(+)
MRPSDTETDSLGVSADSEGQACTSREVEADKDLLEYGQSLGLHDLESEKDADLKWVVNEAFEAPLPNNWTEHVDAEGRVYFFDQISEESTWSHPMDGVYRELIAFIKTVRAEDALSHPERLVDKVREHLLEVHQRALTHLEGWSGPYAAETGQYYFNDRLRLSTWVSPIDGWEYELAVRHSVLHRSLLAGCTRVEDTTRPSSSPDLLMTPMLQLPLGLARREDDAQSSSRSFYTARESSRSGASARSISDVSPNRAKRTSVLAPEVGATVPVRPA